MTNVCYKKKSFKIAALRTIEQANEICADYAAQGYDLTLRQLFYQFVARDLIPNEHKDYKRLGAIVADARLAGLLSWDYITDRTRALSSPAAWDSPAEIIEAAANSYRRDRLENQPVKMQVWVEKEALAGVVERSARSLGVPHFSCRGYVSQSEMWRAGQRLLRQLFDNTERVVILHLGDHDPSGIDMTRDIEDRLFTFVGAHLATFLPEKSCTKRQFRERVQVRRIALNRDQIHRYDPPPNPAKLTDSRAADYISEHGDSSWELDALPPDTLDNLIRDSISDYLDHDLYNEVVRTETEERKRLAELADNWTD